MTTETPTAVAVVGAGTMGHGLALQFARHGAGVTLVDHRESNLADARAGVDDALDFLDANGWLDTDPDAIRARIDDTLDTAAAVAGAEFVVESVSESLDVKADVFQTLVDAAPENAVLASNTSGIPITDIAATVPDAADRVIGCHWWNPPYLMPTVEVVRGAETSDETVARTAAFVEAVDRDPIRVERDVPGFVWNRIQFAVLRECTHLVQEGVASLEDVERAVRDGYALRTAAIGPFETADLAGLDLFETIAADLYPHLSDADAPGSLFADRLDAGRGGVADGAGFHEYDVAPEDVIRTRNERVAAVRRALED
ncbi:3-hydroxybutyryl-CoA dehydrogenase [Haloplanus vescus]|uniref:3-hydroxybutyryl-CoA dehydrogenase n=1 Tax=Haloplanus vescus TaxID=555874 RepID=A0A1H3WV72_9EURY|nr:3-hydroxyacyl-CoA dehydrogenase NAD-binding domain-containing protein [Haloplanus vescus]SDZ90242.1 3-hydroxybutyryl-CoA dehydrogenase [Haloplanus vescus]